MNQLDTMEQTVSKIQDYLSDDTFVQTDSAFVGTALWKAIDLVTFGVLEKEPKPKKQKKSAARAPASAPEAPQNMTQNNSNGTN